ncbi:DUF429 domain-containing protein [Cerasicoccus arenae]|uniref:DUF429 domain-containing protein n=1 Tax=Cerasicoccus arenae TaxID=424488 RepID=A0A8J3DFU4_9BACT|nr:DUF429 domain-containing protein [Cerasicoccus arenae]MBK1859337.1 DUF429 domain-containing protein [Cerasicoccus arenae]GHB93861.1 hypothetical protein GCM10007047_06780 [Cerasicoccus arenae]
MHTLGIVACQAGWLAVAINNNGDGSIGVFKSVYEALIMHSQCETMLINMPIGLPDTLNKKRECDAIARRLLGKGLTARVFDPPPRRTLAINTYEEACSISETLIGRKIARQCFSIRGKIRELDDILRRHHDYVGRLREAHPEIAFAAMNNRAGLRISKKQKAGIQGRLQVLQRHYPHTRDLFNYAKTSTLRKDVGLDDIVDAIALAAMAKYAKKLRSAPIDPPYDTVGLPMETVIGVF